MIQTDHECLHSKGNLYHHFYELEPFLKPNFALVQLYPNAKSHLHIAESFDLK
jgi:hypothetical protein